MEEVKTKYDVGVIIGRFQAPMLTKGHVDIIKHVMQNHSKVVILLGVAHIPTTKRNPLNYEMREQMIRSEFPNVLISYIKDLKNDRQWAMQVDERIMDLIGPLKSVVLYGSRDSALNCYKSNGGCLPVRELEPVTYIDATNIRAKYSNTVYDEEYFRAGVIWATQNRFRTCYPTVDIAIVDTDRKRILLGRKSYESKHRFIGGFAEPNSDCYEDDAKREVFEETGLEISDLSYVGSAKLPDWRYSDVGGDRVKTMVFLAKYNFGTPKPGDDIMEVKWFDMRENFLDILEPVHVPLYELLKPHFLSLLNGDNSVNKS